MDGGRIQNFNIGISVTAVITDWKIRTNGPLTVTNNRTGLFLFANRTPAPDIWEGEPQNGESLRHNPRADEPR